MIENGFVDAKKRYELSPHRARSSEDKIVAMIEEDISTVAHEDE